MKDLFVREDLSKPENRINVALFGLMTVRIFREWFYDRLSIPQNSVLYPPTNVANDGGAGRPDFVVKRADSGETIAWIEVECGSDAEQLARFRRMFPNDRVISVWGRPGPGCDLSLVEISTFLGDAHVPDEPQVRFNAAHLKKLIDEALAGHSQALKTNVVSGTMRETPFLAELRRALGDKLNFDISGPVRSREIRANTKGENGFSIRVYSPKSGIADRSVSVLFRTAGRPEIYFQSKAKMQKYLPGRLEQVDRLVALVDRMGADMASCSLNGRVSVPLKTAEANVPEIAEVLVAIAW